MLFEWLADLVLLAHLAFITFVVLGGALALRWPKLVWVHVPAAAWGVFIEYAGLICPLTPLEIALRRRAGQEPYGGGFISHYLTAVIYPAGLTRGAEIVLGTLVLLLNAAVYSWMIVKRGRRTRAQR